jgi:hypothetical protein
MLFLSGCNFKYQRISFNNDSLGEDIERHINANTVVEFYGNNQLPKETPIYAINAHTITTKEYNQMLSELNIAEDPSNPYDIFEHEGNKVYCNLADFLDSSRGYFDDLKMSESDLQLLARKTFEKIPFLDGNYEYGGVRGKDTIWKAGKTYITRICVSFYRVVDGIRVVGNERCDLWFDGSGLVAIDIIQFDYTKVGTMNLVPLDEAKEKIKTPDDFSIDASEGFAKELQVNKVNLFWVNQHANGCTILQPVYNFVGTAKMSNETEAAFSSRVIAIPESYTYEKE